MAAVVCPDGGGHLQVSGRGSQRLQRWIHFPSSGEGWVAEIWVSLQAARAEVGFESGRAEAPVRRVWRRAMDGGFESEQAAGRRVGR